VQSFFRKVGTQIQGLVYFLVAVARKFRDNKGLLLASGVGYNTLLSVVPLFIVLMFVLSTFFEEAVLIEVINRELRFVVPGHADWLTDSIARIVDERNVAGTISFLAVLFFSSIAFRTFESAMEVIFETKPDRHFLVSVLIPYGFIALIGLSLVALAVVGFVLEMLAGRTLQLLHFSYTVPEISGTVVYLASFAGLFLLFTALYKIIPASRVGTGRAMIGALFAAVLWESVRHIINWYFANISVINVVYGSLTTVVIALLTMEIAASIVLFGAQVIAELEHNAARGVPWYGDLEGDDPPDVSGPTPPTEPGD
jgi:YihY family inner membrane protein